MCYFECKRLSCWTSLKPHRYWVSAISSGKQSKNNKTQVRKSRTLPHIDEGDNVAARKTVATKRRSQAGHAQWSDENERQLMDHADGKRTYKRIRIEHMNTEREEKYMNRRERFGEYLISLYSKISISQDYLTLFKREPKTFLRRFVTVNQICIHCFTTKPKEQSKLWTFPGVSAPKKSKRILTAGKMMTAGFWE